MEKTNFTHLDIEFTAALTPEEIKGFNGAVIYENRELFGNSFLDYDTSFVPIASESGEFIKFGKELKDCNFDIFLEDMSNLRNELVFGDSLQPFDPSVREVEFTGLKRSINSTKEYKTNNADKSIISELF